MSKVTLRITNIKTNLSKNVDATEYSFADYQKTVSFYESRNHIVKTIRTF